MASLREKWAVSFGPDKEVWLLSEDGDVAKYMTKDKPKDNPYGRGPSFHVWKGDEWLYCGSSQEKADAVYNEARKENAEETATV